DVIEVSKKYLPGMAKGFFNPKLTLHVGDGFEFMKKNQDAFDIIITDSSDPVEELENMNLKYYNPDIHKASFILPEFARKELATQTAFAHNPSRVWEFYHYRREVMLTKNPNPAHLAIAECEERLGQQGRKVTVITQNIDELHRRAGSKNLLEIHGVMSFFS
ncbi:hypothetical protein XENOCAPTIV_013390, partial [Xenoophorus captivus]